MGTTYMLNEISTEEMYDIDGGSTKVVAAVALVAGIICGVGAFVADASGNSGAALAFSAAALRKQLKGGYHEKSF